MIGTETTLAIICARGGSKGLPHKHLLDLHGKPLIAWTIEAAHASKYLDRVILSSDCEAIIDVATTHGCEVPFVRESQLAEDTTASIDVVLDAIARCPGYEWIVLLQPTSPLRQTEDIDKALEQCQLMHANSCVSVCETQDNPHWMYTLSETQTMQPLFAEQSATRRQDLPSYYTLNGAIYIARTQWLLHHKSFLSPETIAYIMPIERSIDIDTEFDLKMSELLMGFNKPSSALSGTFSQREKENHNENF